MANIVNLGYMAGLARGRLRQKEALEREASLLNRMMLQNQFDMERRNLEHAFDVELLNLKRNWQLEDLLTEQEIAKENFEKQRELAEKQERINFLQKKALYDAYRDLFGDDKIATVLSTGGKLPSQFWESLISPEETQAPQTKKKQESLFTPAVRWAIKRWEDQESQSDNDPQTKRANLMAILSQANPNLTSADLNDIANSITQTGEF